MRFFYFSYPAAASLFSYYQSGVVCIGGGQQGTLQRTGGVQDAKHNTRILQKVVMAQPFAAAQRMIELGRMYDNISQLLLFYSKSLLPLMQEIILFEVVRFLLVSHVRPPYLASAASPPSSPPHKTCLQAYNKTEPPALYIV